MPKTFGVSLKPQSYSVFIYNSSGSQTGNRFNSWANLMTAITRQEGLKTIIFEQNETIPTGSYNLDNCTLRGNNGLEYNAGGWTLTFGDNTTISSWVGSSIYALRLLSTSTTGNICTFSIPSLILVQSVSQVHSTNYPFFKFTGTGQMIVSLQDSGRWTKLGGGVENLDVTSSAFACLLILARGQGSAPEINTLKSTNGVVFIDVLLDAAQDPTNYPLSNTNLVVGALVTVNSAYSTVQNHIPTTKTSGTYTVTRAVELYLSDASGGNITYNLPAALGYGTQYIFKKIDSSANTVTIDGNSSETIDGATTYVISSQYDSVTIVDAATGAWYIV